MPKVSVVTRTYNYGHFLGEAIQSVLDQTFQDYELIVVDDGSTDDTKQVVSGFSDHRIKYIHQENRGVSAAYNTGISAASGEYLAFLDADDIWLPRKLEVQVRAMESSPQAGLVYSDVYYFDSKTGAITESLLQTLNGPPPRGSVLERHVDEFFAHPSTWLVRRCVFDRVGMFDETQRSSEDEDMLFRIASFFEFEVVPMPLTMARTHAEQESKKTEVHVTYFLQYLKKIEHSPLLNDHMRTRVRWCLAKYHFLNGMFLRRRHEHGRAARELLASFKANPRVFASKAMSQLSGKLTQIVGKLTKRLRPTLRDKEVKGTQLAATYPYPGQVVNKNSAAAKVSIIMPTYNYGCYMAEAIRSVLAQTFKDFELIVVDDGSTDNTKDVVDSFADPRVKYIYQKNRDVSAARNTGILASSGEYIAFLDSDDSWLPQKLELQVKAMDSASKAGIVYSDAFYFDSTTGAVTGTFFQMLKNPPPQGSVLEVHIEEFFAHPSTWLIRRNVFERVGVFDETLRSCEDDDMLFRMASCFEFKVVPIPLTMVRTHPEQKSQKKQIHFTNYLRYLNKATQSPILDGQMRASLRRAMCLCHFRYAISLVRSGKLGKGGREFLASLKANPGAFGYFVMSHLIEKLTRRFRPSRRGGGVEAMPRWPQYLRSGQVVKKNSAVPKVSVVIATYNYGRYLGEAIQSVLDQTFGDFELIVVDDGSTDSTRDVVASFTDPRIRYIYQSNRGSSFAYNRGIIASRGEYITFLDADDVWFPQNLELKVKALDSRPDIGLVCSDTYLFDDETGNILGRYWHDHAQFKGWFDPEKAAQKPLRHMLSRGTFIIETITMVRREVFDDVGGYDVSLKSHEDWDLWCRVTQHFAIETIDLPLAMNRRHSANLSGKPEQMYESEQMALSKALHSYSLQPDEIKLVNRRLARLHVLYGSRSIVDGEIALGRKRLLTSIRIDPWHIEPYFHLVKSLLGYRLIITVRLMKEWLVRRLANADHQAIPVEEFNDGNSASGETDDKDSKKKLYESSQS